MLGIIAIRTANIRSTTSMPTRFLLTNNAIRLRREWYWVMFAKHYRNGMELLWCMWWNGYDKQYSQLGIYIHRRGIGNGRGDAQWQWKIENSVIDGKCETKWHDEESVDDIWDTHLYIHLCSYFRLHFSLIFKRHPHNHIK